MNNIELRSRATMLGIRVRRVFTKRKHRNGFKRKFGKSLNLATRRMWRTRRVGRQRNARAIISRKIKIDDAAERRMLEDANEPGARLGQCVLLFGLFTSTGKKQSKF